MLSAFQPLGINTLRLEQKERRGSRCLPQQTSEPLPDLKVQNVNNKYFTEASPRARYRGLRVSKFPSPRAGMQIHSSHRHHSDNAQTPRFTCRAACPHSVHLRALPPVHTPFTMLSCTGIGTQGGPRDLEIRAPAGTVDLLRAALAFTRSGPAFAGIARPPASAASAARHTVITAR